MKKTTTILFCLLLFTSAFAQQKPHYTQYILNNYILNPALSGIENYTDLKISGRDQWSGLNGAPQTFYLSIHAPIGKQDYKTTATSYSVPGENPRGNQYWQNYEASAPHHGVGLSIVNDKTGNISRFNANVSYAYHLGLSPTMNLAAGFAAGIGKISYDRSKATPTSGADPVLGNNNAIFTKISPDLSAGLWLYTGDYFVGVSAQQIIPQKLQTNSADNNEGKLLPHFFATAGYRFLLSEDINAIPSFVLKYVPGSPTPPQADVNIKLQYRDLLWVGGSYRVDNGFAAMLGLNVGNTFNIGYAYDFTVTPINTASHGTHEVIIGFLLGNRYDDSCPRNVW
jgi:type IX secretion system PorP/SprF family membrane protein